MDGWFRFDHRMMNDIKFICFSIPEKYAWIALLCLSSDSKKKGFVQADDEDIAAYCAFGSTEEWFRFRDKLISKRLLASGDSGYEITYSKVSYPSPPRLVTYRKHRDLVLERDGYKCVYCGAAEALALDHVMPQSRGGSDEPENLVAACKSCNSRKSDRTPEEWLGGSL